MEFLEHFRFLYDGVLYFFSSHEEIINEKLVMVPGWKHFVMILIGGLLIYLALAKDFEPALLMPMGIGAILVNLPLSGAINQMNAALEEEVPGIIDWLFQVGIEASEALPLLLFIGIGAMIDFGPLLSNPKMFLFGAAAQFGIFFTLVVAVIASLFGQPKYYGRPGWERVPTASNRKEVKLGELEKQILEMLRIGHCYMSDLTDALGVDSKTSGAAVENLDQGGYLVRAGMSGSKFYTFTITEKGLAALPALSGKEAEMAEEFLNPLYVQLLKVVKENPEQQAEFVQKNGIKSMRMSAICSHLTRRGYVVEGGLFKRKLRITEKGAAALQKYA